MAELVLVRNNLAVFVGKHGPVGEGERVPVEIKTRGWAGFCFAESQQSRRKTSPKSANPELHDDL
jgi:hypothetical protein